MHQPPAVSQALSTLLNALWAPLGPQAAPDIPWDAVVQLALAQNVAPALHAAIQQAGMSPPKGAAASLEYAHYQTVAADTFRSQDLKRILLALDAAGIPTILLKGVALDQTLYRGQAIRAPGDLDLLVRRDDVPACQKLLIDLGYIPTEVELTPGAQLGYRNEAGFSFREPGHAQVEVHWHLVDIPYYIQNVPVDWFWQNTELVEIAGHPVQVLNPEANLIYLPAHLALHHRFHGLRWFLDMALLVHSYQDTLDWDQVITASQRFELLLVLRQTLERLAETWPSLPLDEPRCRLVALEPTPFEEKLFRLLTTQPRSPFLDFYSDIICLPSVSDRASFVLRNIFPQRTYVLERYGVKRAWELPFWYLYRLGDGCVKAARTLPQVFRLS